MSELMRGIAIEEKIDQ